MDSDLDTNASDDGERAAPRSAGGSRFLGAPLSPRARRAAQLIVWVLCFGVLHRLASVVWLQLGFPFDLVYETPNLATVDTFRAGGNPYAAGTYAGFPFQVTPYTPLFHLLVAALPAGPTNPFLAGRLVSLASMLAAVASLLWVSRTRRWVLPALGAAVFFCLPAAINNAAFFKNDPLALCLSAWAVVAVSKADRFRGAHWVAAVLALLALAAKQNYGAAFLACGGSLLLTNRRKALEFGAVWLGGLVTLCLLAQLTLGRGFWFSTLVVPSNPMVWGQLFEFVVADYLATPVFAALALTTVVSALARRGEPGTPASSSPFLLYAASSALLMLVTIGKDGASTNYLLEVTLAQAMWLIAARGDEAPAGASPRTPLVAYTPALLAACVAYSLVVTSAESVSFAKAGLARNRALAARAWETSLATAGLERPVRLNLQTHMFILDQGDGIVLNDPWLYRLLWRTEKLDTEPMLQALRRGDFDLVVTRPDLPATLSDDRPNRAIETQLLASYLLWWRSPYGDCYRRK